MAIRVFNYTPGYPISYGSGSTETQNTAWSKVVLEFERIYRFINEGFNYFERNIQDIRDIISGGTGTVTDEMVCPVGSIIAYSGLKSQIPSNWHLCDGTGGTPDLRDRFLMGTANAGDLDTYKSAGLPNITGYLSTRTTGKVYDFDEGALKMESMQPGAGILAEHNFDRDVILFPILKKNEGIKDYVLLCFFLC